MWRGWLLDGNGQSAFKLLEAEILKERKSYAALSTDSTPRDLPRRRLHRKCLVEAPHSSSFGAIASGVSWYSCGIHMRTVSSILCPC